MILLALRKARVQGDEKKEEKWDCNKYEKLLARGVIEAYTLFGQYLPNFVYLNSPWAEKKIKEFKSRESVNENQWQSFMDGYLFGSRVYRDLYRLMRDHYLRAVETDFKSDHAEERLIQHITIGYLRGYESLDGQESLFKKIIDNWQYSQLEEIVSFFWCQRDYVAKQAKDGEKDKDSERVRKQILDFWEWSYNQREEIQKKLGENYPKFLSDLTQLTIFLELIDNKNTEWLLLSAPYVNVNYHTAFFIEYLDELTNEGSVNFVSKIFLKMLSGTIPDYPQDKIISIVEKIYQLGSKDEADQICNLYGSSGRDFLKSLWETWAKK